MSGRVLTKILIVLVPQLLYNAAGLPYSDSDAVLTHLSNALESSIPAILLSTIRPCNYLHRLQYVTGHPFTTHSCRSSRA